MPQHAIVRGVDFDTWKQQWCAATHEHQLMSLLHTLFTPHINEVRDSWVNIQRFCLIVADVRSGYSKRVRQAAHDHLFAPRRSTDGFFEFVQYRDYDEKLARSALRFFRVNEESLKKGKNPELVNHDVITGSSRHVQENIDNELAPFLLRLWEISDEPYAQQAITSLFAYRPFEIRDLLHTWMFRCNIGRFGKYSIEYEKMAKQFKKFDVKTAEHLKQLLSQQFGTFPEAVILGHALAHFLETTDHIRTVVEKEMRRQYIETQQEKLEREKAAL